MAFKLFHGKDGVIPLSEKSDFHNGSTEADSLPVFNPLAGRAASISLSGPGGPFSFWNFSEKWKKQKNSESSNKKEYSPQVNICSLFSFFPFSFCFTHTLIGMFVERKSIVSISISSLSIILINLHPSDLQ